MNTKLNLTNESKQSHILLWPNKISRCAWKHLQSRLINLIIEALQNLVGARFIHLIFPKLGQVTYRLNTNNN